MTSLLQYFKFNKTFLSGAMDMIAVKHPDGTLKSTPMRVRFGQFKVLDAKEKNVSVYSNGKIVDLPMKLSEHGEVYIEKEPRIKRDADVSDDLISNSDGSPLSSPRTSKTSDVSDEEVRKGKLSEDINDSMSSFKRTQENSPPTVFSENVNINDMLNSSINSGQTSTNCLSSERGTNQNFQDLKIELSYSWDIISKNKNDEKFNLNTCFNSNKVSQETFFKDPWKVLSNPNLAIKYGNHIYTWKVIAPLIISQLAFGIPLPDASLLNLTQQENGFLMWKTIQKEAFRVDIEKKDPLVSLINKPTKRKKPRKTYTLSSAQIAMLNLVEGKNELKFSVSSKYQGKQELECNIYLWNYNDKILVSDLDGTVTRSDVIGQLFQLLGKDWFHSGIVKLYNDIVKNDYKIIYLTARTMCYHTQTKNYLYKISQDGKTMPSGPLLMSPDGLVSSLKREMIDRTPQSVKIDCLTTVMNIFPSDINPYYCGIGNKKSDSVAYECVGIPKDRIYIINERGEISTNIKNYKLTYKTMDEEIDKMFPYVYDNGYNSLFYDDRIVRCYEPDISKIINEDFEKELLELK